MGRTEKKAKVEEPACTDPVPTPRTCRKCGCTDDDCGACIERTGRPCWWHEDDLCSACAQRFIVAEASTNWSEGEERSPTRLLLSQQFELIIARNFERGYVLHSWRLASATPALNVGTVAQAVLNETIVAVFVLRGYEDQAPARRMP